MKILLKDLSENKIVAIIKTKTTTAEQIQNIISKIKQIREYDSVLLTCSLPKDCKIAWLEKEVDGEVFW